MAEQRAESQRRAELGYRQSIYRVRSGAVYLCRAIPTLGVERHAARDPSDRTLDTHEGCYGRLRLETAEGGRPSRSEQT